MFLACSVFGFIAISSQSSFRLLFQYLEIVRCFISILRRFYDVTSVFTTSLVFSRRHLLFYDFSCISTTSPALFLFALF